MTILINVLTSPTLWVVSLSTIGAAMLWSRWWRSGRVVASLAIVAWGLIAALPVEQYALSPLEERFPQPNLPEHVDGILVLGGAVNAALWRDRGQPSLNLEAERMTEFVTLAHRYPGAKLAFTGGPPPSRPNDPREAEVARALFSALGLDVTRITFEDRATTTWENGVFSKALLAPKPGETWLLVTSADHMARSMGVFRAVGWDMIPVPVGYKSFHDMKWRHGRDLTSKLALLDIAAHEWIGMVQYWWVGRSSALFPAP